MRHPLLNCIVAGASSLVATAFVPLLASQSAHAEDTIFDWGDNDKTVDSGKSHIHFNGPARAGDIIVSFGDRKLYYFTGPGEADTYPVAIPRDQSRWEGVTTVSQKKENPSWTPTAHMMAENPRLPRWVPGGHPMNPLGIRALYLGSSDYRIHGTDAPWTIGTAASKGCVRMFNKDVVDLYPKVRVGAKVTVTWQKFDSNTLTLAERAPPVSDPDPDHGHAGKPLASYATTPAVGDSDETDAPKSARVRHPRVSAVEEPAEQNSKVEKAWNGSDDEPAAPVSRKHSSADDAVEKGSARTASEESMDERKPRKVSKSATHVETGSIASESKLDGNSDNKSDAATLAATRSAALAAEKAANAAERAASAAERASGGPATLAPAIQVSPDQVPVSAEATVKTY